MELSEMKSIWQSYDNKLDRSLRLNLRCIEIIQAQKVKNKLRPLLWARGIEAALDSIMIIWLSNFLVKNFTEIKFIVASFSLILFFIIALASCIKQIILIKQIDYTEDVLSIQKKLTLLHSHVVDYIGLSFLAFPTYLAYPVIAMKAFANLDILDMSHDWWIANIAFTALITPVCIWLYTQVTYKNIHKRWVKYIIEKSVGKRVSKAMEFMKEIDELKQIK